MHFNLSELSAVHRNIQQMGLITLVILVLSSYHITEATNYCNYCKNHVACHNNGDFGKTCSADKQLLRMSASQKEYIVSMHNRMRNNIALGKIDKYSPAAKMPCFQWQNELAYLAEMNARSCTYGHDECRATEKYPWAGQNIARRGNTKGYENTKSAIKHMINDWYIEYKDADMGIINSYHNHPMGKKIGHFTVMVSDKNNAIGCAMIRYKEDGFFYRYLVCNYGYTNVIGRPVYTKGPAGSRCKKQHPVYEGLCSGDQIVLPIP